MNEKVLGKHLQEARQKAGITQQQLCDRAGLSYSTLAKIERGAIKAPSIFTVSAIAATLGVTLDQLMGEFPARLSHRSKKHSKTGVSFVYFDVNGVLVRFFHRAFTMIAEDTGAPADLIETTFWHYNDSACRGAISVKEFSNILSSELKTPALDWSKYYFAAIDPINEMQETVRWASQYYKIGLLSNAMPGFIKELIDRKLVPDMQYDSIIDSSEVGFIKPEAKMYEIAQQKAGVPGSEILLIDDSRTNVMTAEHAGWHVLWFDDYRPEESVGRVKAALEF